MNDRWLYVFKYLFILVMPAVSIFDEQKILTKLWKIFLISAEKLFVLDIFYILYLPLLFLSLIQTFLVELIEDKFSS